MRPVVRFAVLSLVLTALFLSSTAADELHIGKVTVQTRSVFSESETGEGSFYAIVDVAHARTRPSVIRAFLLFREGDVYDEHRLRETERNLRALRFLRNASVTAGQPQDGVVDVTVITDDAWSIEPGTTSGSSGGKNTFGAQLSDPNLGGTGRSAAVSFSHGVDRSRMMLELTDPSFFRPYTKARLAYSRNSDGFERRLSVIQPFYALSDPRAGELSYDSYRRDDSIYGGGHLLAAFRHDHRQFVAALGTAIDVSDTSATRLTAGVRILDDRVAFSDPRTYRYLFVRIQRLNDHFITRNFVDKDIQYQDIDLGRQLFAEVAVSPRFAGAQRTSGFFNAGVSQGADYGNAFVMGSAAVQSRLENGLRNAILSGNARYVRQLSNRVPQTLIARALVNQGWNLDPEQQFFADAAAGLRGYRLHAFEGTGNAIGNLEYRISLGREILHLVSPGLAAFIDTGSATDRFRSRGLKTDVGLGIRFALPRSTRNLLLLDVAYALQRDPLNRRGLVVSFSSGASF